VGPNGRSLGHWEGGLEAGSATPGPSFVFLLLPVHEVSGFAPHCPLAMMCCLQPKASGPMDHGPKIPKQ
jgi:hypothetical protein